MRTLTKEEIIKSFNEKEKKSLKIPDLRNIDWNLLDYLGWIHPSGHLGYIVYENNQELKGVILKKTTGEGKRVVMCSLCLTIQSNKGISIFSATVKSKKNMSIGIFICSNLDCSLYVRNKKGISPHQMRETISTEKKIKRLTTNLEDFLNRIY